MLDILAFGLIPFSCVFGLLTNSSPVSRTKQKAVDYQRSFVLSLFHKGLDGITCRTDSLRKGAKTPVFDNYASRNASRHSLLGSVATHGSKRKPDSVDPSSGADQRLSIRLTRTAQGVPRSFSCVPFRYAVSCRASHAEDVNLARIRFL